jgi:hypothetical protein
MQIKFLAREGMQKKTIAERLGVSRQTVYNHLSRSDDEPFRKRARRDVRSSTPTPITSVRGWSVSIFPPRCCCGRSARRATAAV